MRAPAIFIVCALLPQVAAEPALSAVKYQRFPHCAASVITVKNCECHSGESPRYHYCHAGEACRTDTGRCAK